jgi:hypothetical protein
MKKIPMATLLPTLLILTLAYVLFVGTGLGNPVYQKRGYDFISILSPTEKTYNAGPIYLSFTFETNFNPSYLSFCYALDGNGEYLTGPIWDAMLKVSERTVSAQIVSDDDPGLGLGPYPPYTNYVIACGAKLPPLEDGEHCVTVYRGPNYPAKNAGYEPFGTVYFRVDSKAPRVLLLSPGNLTYDASSVLISFRLDGEVSWLGLSLDGKAPLAIAGNTTLSGLSDGAHTLVVQAEDTAGSKGASAPVKFTIETQTAGEQMGSESASFPTTFVGVAIIVSVAIISFGLVAYFVKRSRRKSK